MLPSTRICFFLSFTPFLLPSWLFYFIVRTGWCLSFMAWKTCGLLGSCSLPFIPSWTRCCLGKGLHLSVKPMFSSLVSIGLLVIDPAISLCHAYYSFTFLHITLWTCGLIFLLCQPTSSSIFCSRLPWPTFHIFTSFRLCWPTFLLCQPNSLLHFPSFPVPFTSSLPLIISMGLLLHSLGFLGPIYSFFTYFYSYELSSHQSYYFNLLGLFPCSFTIFPFSPSLYCWASSAIGPFVKSGHQQLDFLVCPCVGLFDFWLILWCVCVAVVVGGAGLWC